MKRTPIMFATGVFTAALMSAAALGVIAPAHSAQDNPKPAPAVPNLAGLHDFDFLVGEWRRTARTLNAYGLKALS